MESRSVVIAIANEAQTGLLLQLVVEDLTFPTALKFFESPPSTRTPLNPEHISNSCPLE